MGLKEGLGRFLPRRFVLHPAQVALSGLLLFMNTDGYLLLLLLAAWIHEAGHLICAGLSGQRVEAMSLGLMGARIRLSGHGGSYVQDALVAFWGAGANLLCLFPAWCVIRATGGSTAAIFFFFCSLFLALMNLLPADGLDGGVILHSLAAQRFDLSRADLLLALFSRITVGVLLVISLFLWQVAGNLSLLIVCASLFFRLLCREGE